MVLITETPGHIFPHETWVMFMGLHQFQTQPWIFFVEKSSDSMLKREKCQWEGKFGEDQVIPSPNIISAQRNTGLVLELFTLERHNGRQINIQGMALSLSLYYTLLGLQSNTQPSYHSTCPILGNPIVWKLFVPPIQSLEALQCSSYINNKQGNEVNSNKCMMKHLKLNHPLANHHRKGQNSIDDSHVVSSTGQSPSRWHANHTESKHIWFTICWSRAQAK